ncbi:MAG: GDP-mannose 4,6-dehydratase [Myxococcota bacterium]|nr:GDP-mannose 4,6-dehydratase [Myxococcota bacterium]
MTVERTLLVTGGAGFIGAHFVTRHLARFPRDRVIVLDALTYAGSLGNLPEDAMRGGRLEFVHGSVRSPALMDALTARSDAVVHFAAETHVPRSIVDALVFLETDVLGTQMVLAQALRHRDRVRRVVHISSSEVYGSAVRTPMDEDHPLDPCTPYAAAKCGADRLVSSFAHTYGLPVVILRPFNNYGPGQHLEKLVQRLVTSALLDEPLTVHGTGAAARDWVFVHDTCDAIECVLERPDADVVGQVFNVGTGIATDVLTMARKVSALAGRDAASIAHTDERPGQVRLHVAATKKAIETLGFETRIGLDAGLALTLAWYRENRARWEPQRWMRSVPVVDGDGRFSWW